MTRRFLTRTRRLLTNPLVTRSRRFQTFFLIILPLLIASAATAQPPDTLFTRIWDYSSDEAIECVRALSDGGYIATGWSRVGLPLQVWTTRLDQDGNEIWQHIEGGEFSDGAHYIEPTNDGGFIQCGETWSYSTHNSFDAFIRKLNAEGEQEWARVYGSSGDVGYFCVREVPAGGYIAAGDSHLGPSVTRFDNTGQILWEWEDPGALFYLEWVEPLADGGFAVTSEHFSQEANTRVPILYKLDAVGDTVWSNDRTVDGVPLEGRTVCVREDVNGFLYQCGTVRNPNGITYYDLYVSKRNPDGSEVWSILIDNENSDAVGLDKAYELVILPDANLAVGGYSPDDSYSDHLWLLKISPDGELLWLYDQPGGEIWSLDQGRDGSMIAAYWPRENGGFDPVDLALLKWEPEVTMLLEPDISIIPPQGMRIHYAAYVSNILLDPTPLDVWATVTTPAGNTYPLQQITVTLQPGSSFDRPSIPLDIPAAAPPGEYSFELHIGVAPPDDPPGGPNGSRTMGLGSFTFTKSDGR